MMCRSNKKIPDHIIYFTFYKVEGILSEGEMKCTRGGVKWEK